MTIHAFTSFSFSYLSRARVLAKSLKQQHPDWVFWAVITDRCPDGLSLDNQRDCFDHFLFPEDIVQEDADTWLFGHNVVEACTAVKGAAARYILDTGECQKLFYLDPDIAVFNPLSEIAQLLDDHAIVLTPHQTQPVSRDNRQSIVDNEICSLMHGAYNLGFFAVSKCDEAHRFLSWWDDRLRDWCHDRKDIGVFVDQKWCDLIPCLFEDVKILRDPGYNVASWNLFYRKMSFDPHGQARINGEPLRFFHFTKLGAVGDAMTQRYAGENFEVFELWSWYKNQVKAEEQADVPQGYWHYGTFDNGCKIPDAARRLYRERADLRAAFSDPRSVSNGYFGWVKSETDLLEGVDE